MKGGFSKDFLQELREVLQRRKESEGKKFLGIFSQGHLKVLEKLLKTDFGTHKRNRRPFLGYYFGKWLFVCLLTAMEKGSLQSVEIKLCKKGGCRFNFQETSYVFYDRENRGFYIYQLPKDLIKDYSFCGYCEDLEHIDKLSVIEVRGGGLQGAFN